MFLLHRTRCINVIEFSPLLSPNATYWSFSLVILFYNALSVELQEEIRLDGYTLPNNSTLSILSSQISTLQVLREKDVVIHKLLREEKQRVLSILNYVSPRKLVRINPMYSQVESTICSHHPATPCSRPSRPLVKGNDGKFYPKKPITNYISRFANGFSDCLGCGSETHLFRGCPEKHTSEMKKNFFLI